MLNVSLDCFSVIESRSVLQTNNVHCCCVFCREVCFSMARYFALLGDVSIETASPSRPARRVSGTCPPFLQAVAGPQKVPADSVS